MQNDIIIPFYSDKIRRQLRHDAILPQYFAIRPAKELVRGHDFKSDAQSLDHKRHPPQDTLLAKNIILDPGVIFGKEISERIHKRIQSQIKKFWNDTDGPDESKASLWTLLNRKSNYISNNHLQYIGMTETIHPLYTKKLIEFRLSHSGKVFTKDLYREILRRFYPEIGNIPHSSDLIKNYNTSKMFSHSLRKSVAGLFF